MPDALRACAWRRLLSRLVRDIGCRAKASGCIVIKPDQACEVNSGLGSIRGERIVILNRFGRAESLGGGLL
jgi:hypothetical protein